MAVIPPEDEDADATDHLDEEVARAEGEYYEGISEAERAEEEEKEEEEDDDDDDEQENAEEDACDENEINDEIYRHDAPPPSCVVEYDSPPNVDDGIVPLIDARDDEDEDDDVIISSSTPSTPLEYALLNVLERRTRHNESLINEVTRLREFLSKRKQTYRRKRTDVDAPRKKLSGYNIFVRERFAELARENEEALRMGVARTTTTATTIANGSGGDEIVVGGGIELKRIPPASNITSTGKAWSMLSAEEKERYNAM